MRKRRASFMIDPKLVPTVWFDGRKTNLLQTMSKTIVLCCVAYDERYTIFPYRAFFTWAMPSNTHTHKLITINAISSDTTNRIWVSYIYCIEKKRANIIESVRDFRMIGRFMLADTSISLWCPSLIASINTNRLHCGKWKTFSTDSILMLIILHATRFGLFAIL